MICETARLSTHNPSRISGDAAIRGAAMEIVTMRKRDGIVAFGRTLRFACRFVDMDAVV